MVEKDKTWKAIASPNFWKERKAMKNYNCGECDKPINKKDVYYSLSMSQNIMRMFASQVPENGVLLTKMCVSCFNLHKKRFKEELNNKDISDEEPDFNDTFAPNLNSSRIVKCLHCGDEYQEKEIKWIPERGMWYCKNYPTCDGAGLGFDIQ